jgi:hypothetical protein
MNLHNVLCRTATRFVPAFASPIQCLVCGRARTRARRLVSGPAPPIHSGQRVRCDWCRAPRLSTQLLALGPTAVCTACLDYMRAIAVDAGQYRDPDA